MEPKTWDEAARMVLLKYDALFHELEDKEGAILHIEILVHNMATEMQAMVPISEKYFLHIARRAVGHLMNEKTWDPHRLGDLLCSKQHDYGHGNINKFGLNGLVVRLSDKVARLKNLESKPNPRNEAILDTWEDIVGYCVIAEMLMDGTFQYELEDHND